jgi:hypothetical protein
MGILDNFEASLEFESKPIVVTDDMGREIFWGDLGRPDTN